MSQLYVDNIRNRTGGPIGIPTGAVVTGVLTATTGNITGNMTVGGVLTYEDVTNIDSVGIITAQSGLRVVGGGATVTGVSTFFSDVSIADKIIHTGDTNTAIRFPAADNFTIETGGTERARVNSGGVLLGITAGVGEGGTPADFNSTEVGRGFINLSRDDTAAADHILFGKNGSIAASVGTDTTNTLVFKTGTTERLRITSTGGVHFSNAELIERVSIVGNKLSAAPNVNLDNGMVHYYTTNETTTANPNIITTAGINTNMATGDTMSVTIMSKPNNAGYFPRISIDGRLAGITTYWSGGSAPDSAESSGIDVNVYQIIKTADETFDVLANTSNFA